MAPLVAQNLPLPCPGQDLCELGKHPLEDEVNANLAGACFLEPWHGRRWLRKGRRHGCRKSG
eukprot:11222264-Lingulodinium_polyedra.AAC.1